MAYTAHRLWKLIGRSASQASVRDERGVLCIAKFLRNHGFFVDKQGIRLSPAYGINPSVDRNELSLAIDETDATCDVAVAMSAYKAYGISKTQADMALKSMEVAVASWRLEAQRFGISRAEQNLMAASADAQTLTRLSGYASVRIWRFLSSIVVVATSPLLGELQHSQRFLNAFSKAHPDPPSFTVASVNKPASMPKFVCGG